MMISQQDLPTVLEIARVALEANPSYVSEVLDLPEAELERILNDINKTLGGE